MSSPHRAGNMYPVGTVVASANEVWIKSENLLPQESPFYQNWWSAAVGYPLPVFSDNYIAELIRSGDFTVLRLGPTSLLEF